MQHQTVHTLDLRGLKCPLPVLMIEKAVRAAAVGTVFCAHCTDGMSVVDVPDFLQRAGHQDLGMEQSEGVFVFHFKKAEKI